MCNQKISVCIYAALVSQESNSWLFTWTGEDLFFKPLLEQLGLSTRASKVTWPEIKREDEASVPSFLFSVFLNLRAMEGFKEAMRSYRWPLFYIWPWKFLSGTQDLWCLQRKTNERRGDGFWKSFENLVRCISDGRAMNIAFYCGFKVAK